MDGGYVLSLKGLYCVKDAVSKEKPHVQMVNGACELLKYHFMEMTSSQWVKLDQ